MILEGARTPIGRFLGGLAGAIQMLGLITFYAPGITANVGFDSITVALLGRSSPVGIRAPAARPASVPRAPGAGTTMATRASQARSTR